MLTQEDLAWSDALNKLRSPWERLVAEGTLNPSLLPEWIEIAAASNDVLERLRVFALRDGGELIGLMPYYRTRLRMAGVPIQAINLASNLISYHPEFITHAEPDRLLVEFLDSFDKRNWNLFIVDGLPNDSPSLKALQNGALSREAVLVNYAGETSPAVRLPGTWEEYLASKRTKFRNNLKRHRRALLKEGQIETRWFREPDDVPALLGAILSIESHSWKVDADMAISERPQERRYYELLLPWMAERGLLLANVIYVGAEPIAYNLCYVWHGCLGQIKTSFDDRFRKLSPGSALIEDVIRRGIELGATEFDFLGDVMPHKLLWMTHVRTHCNCFLFANTWPAKLIGSAKRALQAWRTRGAKNEVDTPDP